MDGKTLSSAAKLVITRIRALGFSAVIFSMASIPAHFRHDQIHQHHIRLETFHLLDGVLAVDRFADHLDILLLSQQGFDSPPYHGMVVHDHDFDDVAHGLAPVIVRGRHCEYLGLTQDRKVDD